MSPRTSSTPLALELGGEVVLAVQQRVEHAHLAAGGEQFVDGADADVAGSAGDQGACAHAREPSWAGYLTPRRFRIAALSGGTSPDVRLRGLKKVYGTVAAVDGVDLEIARGEFFTMLGPSGSGKTTTLRLIAGFEIPDAGTVELAGRDVTGLPPYARDVNTVFQDYALFPHMTVGENVEYGLRIKKVDKDERRRRAAEALELVRLEGYDARKPGPALRRPAPARRAGAGDRQPPAACCCSTNRSVRSTSSCARRCSQSSSASSARSASRSST